MKKTILAACCALLPFSAWAEVQVSEVWARPSVAGQGAAGVFMQLQTTEPTTLIGGESPLANAVEVHEMVMQDDVMKMRRLENGLPLTPDKGAELVPGGLHIMLIGLQKPLAVGDTVPLKLFFKDAQGEQQTVETTAEVRPMMMPADKGKMTEKHLHHHHAH